MSRAKQYPCACPSHHAHTGSGVAELLLITHKDARRALNHMITFKNPEGPTQHLPSANTAGQRVRKRPRNATTNYTTGEIQGITHAKPANPSRQSTTQGTRAAQSMPRCPPRSSSGRQGPVSQLISLSCSSCAQVPSKQSNLVQSSSASQVQRSSCPRNPHCTATPAAPTVGIDGRKRDR